MALQNRVTPTGEIMADPARGLFMGNRGILHDDARRLGKSRWRHRNWIICLLEFRGRRRDVMSPRHYTELFFLDEAVALAAGHRPCVECRRNRYRAFLAAWTAGTGHDSPTPKAHEFDAVLHAARLDPGIRRQRTFRTELAGLPDGVFIRLEDTPLLVLGDRLLPWAPWGYGDAIARPSGGLACVLTPQPTVAAIAAGYRPELHASATGACTAVSFRHAGQDR